MPCSLAHLRGRRHWPAQDPRPDQLLTKSSPPGTSRGPYRALVPTAGPTRASRVLARPAFPGPKPGRPAGSRTQQGNEEIAMEHAHDTVVHTHNHAHMVHYLRHGSQWEHMASTHSHEHNHPSLEHDHDPPVKAQAQHLPPPHTHNHTPPPPRQPPDLP